MGKYTLVVTDTGNDIGTLTGQTLSLGVLSGSGPKGDGFTGGSYDTGTKTFTFTSNDGLGFTSGPIVFNVVDDTTPQLGGDLDLNSNDITGTGDINVTGSVTGTDFVVNGDLTVSGTTTTVNTETINLADNVILVNSNYSGSSPTEDGGIELERGTWANKTLVWNETSDKWTVGSETFVAATFEGNLTGNVTGDIAGDVTGNADTATALETSRTFSLTGDATGSASFDGSSDASITVTIADDSHNHTIANIDGLQTALDGKASDGANSDISSLSGLTTALSVAQGGTGATTAEAARTSLDVDQAGEALALAIALG
jgi:hypothetical protein